GRGDKVCTECGGEGRVVRSRTIEVNIPAGAREGSTMRLRGQGEPGSAGAQPGDLIPHLPIPPPPGFPAEGGHPAVTGRIAPWEAVLGTKIEVPTIDGRVEVGVPGGSQTSQRLRIRGRGLSRRKGGRGDLYVRLAIVVPETVSEQERRLYEELRAASRF